MATNREMFRRGVTPCEWNPTTGTIALLSDSYHAAASVAIGQTSKFKASEDRRLQVCDDCAHRQAALDAASTTGLRIVRRPLRKSPETSLGAPS